MPIPVGVIIFEIFVTASFIGTAFLVILKKEWLDLLVILGATVFGVTLEYFNVLLYDTYVYNPLFFLQIGIPPQNIPLGIGMGWGLIIYSSMLVSNSLSISKYAKPFLDATLALTIDLSMDAIAIRLDGGFWTWFLPLTPSVSVTSFFGVPYANFYGWWMVVLIFSCMARIGRSLWRASHKLGAVFLGIIPFLSYIPLYYALEMIRESSRWFYSFGFYSDETQALFINTFFITILLLFIGLVIPLMSWKCQEKRSATTYRHNVLLSSMVPRITFFGFHLVFLLLGTLYQLWSGLPLLLLVSSLLLGFHVYLRLRLSHNPPLNPMV